MAMTKKHYEQFAYRINARVTLIAEARADGFITPQEADVAHEAVKGLVDTLCIDFRKDNAAFNTERFLNACSL